MEVVHCAGFPHEAQRVVGSRVTKDEKQKVNAIGHRMDEMKRLLLGDRASRFDSIH